MEQATIRSGAVGEVRAFRRGAGALEASASKHGAWAWDPAMGQWIQIRLDASSVQWASDSPIRAAWDAHLELAGKS